MRLSSRVIDRVSRTTPLGVCFRDEVTGSVVGEGLAVSAYPQGQPSSRRPSVVNRSGIHVFMDLPGLRDLEFGAGDTAWWQGLIGRKHYTVEVRDEQHRFLPLSFQVDLPHQGLVQFNSRPFVPLFSAPARQVASTLAVVRAELWDTQAQAPAAWALVQATLPGGGQVRGVADEEGRLALFFQYPAPVDSPTGPPPPLGSPPLLEQKWTLQLRAFHAHRAPEPELPDLRDTLRQQDSAPARLWPNLLGPQELLEPTLLYGRELVVRTEGELRSRLRLTGSSL